MELQPYWTFQDKIAIVNGVTKTEKKKYFSITASKGPKELNINHVETHKARIVACESMYCINMKSYIEELIKSCPTFLDFQAT